MKENKSQLTFKKKALITLTILILTTVGLTIGIGNYFVNYALVPQSGGDDRQVDLSLQTGDELEAIHAARQKHVIKRDEWLESVKADQEEIQIESNDGLTLTGHIFTQPKPTNDWVIIVHGYQSTEEEALLVAPHFYSKEYNILSIQQRAHGKSEGEYITMGAKESEDLLNWTQWLIEKEPESDIVWHGTSMGAATVMMAAPQAPEQVYAIIEDCGYTTAWDIFSSELKLRFNLPSFPVLNMANIVAKARADVNFRQASSIEAVRQSSVPMLFIHGTADDFVPEWMVYDLYDAKEVGLKELYTVPQAGHTEAKFKDGSNYYEKIDQFIEQARQER
ncbi:alpha/beta hydrolase [Dolosicoccus paucivorans]